MTTPPPKRGRPKQDVHRDHTIAVRLTAEEFAQLEAMAQSEALCVAAWARRVLLLAIVKSET